MPYAELILSAIGLSVTIFTVLVGGWFAKRQHDLETRIDTLEKEQQYQWGRERQLVDFIYRHNLTPPPPPERAAV